MKWVVAFAALALLPLLSGATPVPGREDFGENLDLGNLDHLGSLDNLLENLSDALNLG